MQKLHIGTSNEVTKFEDLKANRKGKKTVAFVGMSPSTRELAPFDDSEIEIFTLGRSWRDVKIEKGEKTKKKWVKRISRHFEIHPDSFCHLDTKPDELHFKWLEQNHPFIIYMDDKYEKYPASVRYPIERAVNTFGRHFTSTMSYMFPIAEFEGFDRIELYGFEMGLTGEYAYQMPEVSYHIGWFRAKHGYDSVVIPPSSRILRAPLYAYEEMYNPILTSIEQRIHVLGQNLIKETAGLEKYNGALEIIRLIKEDIPGIEHNEKFGKLEEETKMEQQKQSIMVNSLLTATNESKVLKDAIYYMMPPSYKAAPTADENACVVPWNDVDLPWREAENVTETREES